MGIWILETLEFGLFFSLLYQTPVFDVASHIRSSLRTVGADVVYGTTVRGMRAMARRFGGRVVNIGGMDLLEFKV
jgi:hypothetical protein